MIYQLQPISAVREAVRDDRTGRMVGIWVS